MVLVTAIQALPCGPNGGRYMMTRTVTGRGHRERERERDRQTDRQTDRQINRENGNSSDDKMREKVREKSVLS